MESITLTQQQKQIVHQVLIKHFPKLSTGNYEVRSKYTPKYNCIAFAADVYTIPWWPSKPIVAGNEYYWPEGVPREETIESFILAFATKRYEPCDNGDYEEGFDKTALYVNDKAKPTHMAKQIGPNVWGSKLGDAWDIHHTLESLESDVYGHVAQFLRRPKAESQP
jgi:hypothetical protein